MALQNMVAATGQKYRDDSTVLNTLDLATKRVPLKASATVSIAASGTGTATISVSGYVYFIKSWSVTKGADVTVTSITIDGNDTSQIVAVTDTEATYGTLLTANSSVAISGSNAGAAAEDLTIEIIGYKVATS